MHRVKAVIDASSSNDDSVYCAAVIDKMDSQLSTTKKVLVLDMKKALISEKCKL